MIQWYTPAMPEPYHLAAERVFRFLRHHSDDAYSSQTMMALAAQAAQNQAPFMVVDEYDTEIDRLTEVKRGGIRTAGAVLRDGRVMIATHEKHRRRGYAATMVSQVLQQVQQRDGMLLQFWVANTNVDGLRFLLSQGLTLQSSTPSAQCYGFGHSPL